MNTRMLLCTLLLICAGVTRAQFQWDVRLAELDAVECWDPATCAATDARAYLSVFETGQPLTLPASIWGPGGQPLGFSFQLQALDCELNYVVDSLWMSFAGPGFQYEFTHVPSNPPLFFCGLEFPLEVPVPPGDGCVTWTWPDDCELDCDIFVTQDFVVPAGETLTIPPGSTVYCLPGVGLTIRGELRAPGSAEHPIIFEGDSWDGLEFVDEGSGQFSHCRIRGVEREGDGGALRLTDNAQLHMTKCLVSDNASTGDGGAAWLAGQSVLSLQACTMSHNRGAATGGVQLVGGQALLESNLSLLTHAEPVNSEVRGEGFVNLQVTDVYPQQDGFPAGMAQPFWRCDPGYANPQAGDFQLSYWSLVDPTAENCVIDVSLIPEETDPDGTPGDMGAFPFDQHLIFQAPRGVHVDDQPGDEGGWVWLRFQASLNDGSPLNPVLGYSLWMRYPGAAPADPWISMGFLPATGRPDGQLQTLLRTWGDQTEGQPNLHEFRVAAHSVDFPQPAFAPVCTGYSMDNVGPPPVFNVDHSAWYYDMEWPPTEDLLDLTWDYHYGADFGQFEVLVSLVQDLGTAVPAYAGPQPNCTLSFPFGQLQEGDPLYCWIRAVDLHGNASPWVEHDVIDMFPATDVVAQAPQSWSLLPAAPNPFNPVTHIRYNLGAPGDATLGVWNLAGQRVAVLVDGPQAAGPHDVLFDARGLASGLYIYRLEGGGRTLTGRMLLAR